MTNHDAVFYSLLYSAQTRDKIETQNCPLRLKNTKPTENIGLIYGSAIAMIMASTKVDDDVIDQNNIVSRFIAKIIKQKMPNVITDLDGLDFNLKYVSSEIKRQQVLENQETVSLVDLTIPTENVVSEIFTHTARLSNNIANVEPLADMGRNVGRLMYIVDSYVDLPDDVANGRFNALARKGLHDTRASLLYVKELSVQAFRNIHNSVDHLELPSHAGIVKEALITSLKQGLKTLFNPNLYSVQNMQSFNPSLSLGSFLEESRLKYTRARSHDSAMEHTCWGLFH